MTNVRCCRWRIGVLALLVLLLVGGIAGGCGGKCSVMCCKDITVLGSVVTKCNAFRSDDCSCPGAYYQEYIIRDRR